jgi:hypothetical protein
MTVKSGEDRYWLNFRRSTLAMSGEIQDERCLTPFQLFSVEMRKKKIKWQSRMSPLEFSRRVAPGWLDLKPADKAVYFDQAGRPYKRQPVSDVIGHVNRSSLRVRNSLHRARRTRCEVVDESILDLSPLPSSSDEDSPTDDCALSQNGPNGETRSVASAAPTPARIVTRAHP